MTEAQNPALETVHALDALLDGAHCEAGSEATIAVPFAIIADTGRILRLRAKGDSVRRYDWKRCTARPDGSIDVAGYDSYGVEMETPASFGGPQALAGFLKPLLRRRETKVTDRMATFLMDSLMDRLEGRGTALADDASAHLAERLSEHGLGEVWRNDAGIGEFAPDLERASAWLDGHRGRFADLEDGYRLLEDVFDADCRVKPLEPDGDARRRSVLRRLCWLGYIGSTNPGHLHGFYARRGLKGRYAMRALARRLSETTKGCAVIAVREIGGERGRESFILDIRLEHRSDWDFSGTQLECGADGSLAFINLSARSEATVRSARGQFFDNGLRQFACMLRRLDAERQ